MKQSSVHKQTRETPVSSKQIKQTAAPGAHIKVILIDHLKIVQ